MLKPIRIGTRDSQLAVWQATWVQGLLQQQGVASELVFIKSEGDIDTITPLYALGVTGVFTKTLDAALLNNRIDIAVHSMKDVPVQLAEGLQQAAVLKRASYKDIFVPHPASAGNTMPPDAVVATSSIRRIAQWKHRYPNHIIENLRGNVNTRLRKLAESHWQGAIFAAAGLERIGLRPENAIDLDWMLPAPAQGAVMIACRKDDAYAFESCLTLNNEATALCTKIERDFLSGLMGGCSTPISALAQLENHEVIFKGQVIDPTDPQNIAEASLRAPVSGAAYLGSLAAENLLANGRVQNIIQRIRKKGLASNEDV